MELKTIEVSNILANFYQPRTKFDRESIKELSESILSNGLINPITVSPDKKRKGKFMIVSGERRWQSHRIAKIKTIPCVVKEYKNDAQFMIESLIENVHREDLSSMETAKFIKKIWVAEGKPMNKYNIGAPDCEHLSRMIGLSSSVIGEHLSLVEDKTPKKVKKAVDEGKLAMRSASMIKNLPEKEQEAIAEEAIKRETGMGRTEVTELIAEQKPKPIEYERTANDVVISATKNLHDFKYNVDLLLKGKGKHQINLQDLRKDLSGDAITTAGLHLKVFKDFVNALRQRGARPNKMILALIKANGKI